MLLTICGVQLPSDPSYQDVADENYVFLGGESVGCFGTSAERKAGFFHDVRAEMKLWSKREDG